MIRRWIAALGVLLVVVFAQNATAQEEAKKQTVVGVVVDGPSERYEAFRKQVESEISALVKREFDVVFPENKRIVGDYTVGTTKKNVTQLLEDEEVTLVIAFGVLASNDVIGRRELSKPTIAPFVLDARLQGLEKRGKQNRKNLSYITWSQSFERDLHAFLELGEFKKIAFIGSAATLKAMRNLEQGVQLEAKKFGVEMPVVPMDTTAKSALEKLPAGIDAVFVGPNPQVGLGEIKKLADAFVERRLPTYSWFGREEVELGLLAGLGSTEDLVRLSRRVALNVQSVLLGEDPTQLVTAFRQHERLVLNMSTARAIGLWPNWSVITDAILLNQERKQVQRKLTLQRAVRDAMRANLDLSIAKQRVLAGAAEIRRARSSMLPQLGVSVGGTIIDRDRASFGQAERQLQWSATLNQTIYSQQALANVKIQKQLQRTRHEERQEVKLDVALQTALAYLNLLRAQTFERIQRENLSLTRSNLSLSRVRRQIGTAGPGEVFRWEAQIANARRDVISTVAQRNQAEIALNQLLNRPLEEPFVTKEASLEDQVLISSEKRFQEYLKNPFSFKVLREFMVTESMRNAPELRRINAAMRAQRRLVKSNKRSLYVPTIGAQGSFAHKFLQGGAGTGSVDIPPLPDGTTIDFPSPDEFDWSVGLSATLPLYEGGARYAAIDQAEREYQQLRLEKKLAAQLIEQRIRSALHQAGASFPAIQLSRDAAEAAKGNLDVVTDAYSRGAADIITLLDAQNQSLVADLSAASAAFDFLADLMEVERAMGQFNFFRKAGELDGFFGRLDSFSRSRRSNTGARTGPTR